MTSSHPSPNARRSIATSLVINWLGSFSETSFDVAAYKARAFTPIGCRAGRGIINTHSLYCGAETCSKPI